MIEVEMLFGDEEYRALSKIYANSKAAKKRILLLNICSVILGLACIFFGLHRIFLRVTFFNVFFLAMAVWFFATCFFRKQMIYRSSYRKTKKFNDGLNAGVVKRSFCDEYLATVSAVSESKSTWNLFCDYGEYDHYLWIQRSDKQYILIDKTKLSAPDCAKLLEYCARHIVKA